MVIAGLLVPEEKSRCSQVPAIEMEVRGGGGGGGGRVTVIPKKKLMV